MRNDNHVPDVEGKTHSQSSSQIVGHTHVCKLSTSNPNKQFKTSASRIFERGVLLVFEIEPYWLFALHPNFVLSLLIDNGGIDNFSEFHQYLSISPRLDLYNNLISRVGRNKFLFTFCTSKLDPTTIVLVSGSPAFYHSVTIRYPSLTTIYLFDNHHPKNRLPPSALPLRRLRHSQVGGPTSFVGIVGYHNASVIPASTFLRRTITHFLDHSIRPDVCRPNGRPHHTPNQLLNTNLLSRPVMYPTSFHASKMGSRSLTPSELGLMFGLGELLSSTASLKAFPFPPIQIMDALLAPLLNELLDTSPSVSILQIATPQTPTHTYIPGVGLLPVSWSYVDYSVDKAAKHADTEPVFRH